MKRKNANVSKKSVWSSRSTQAKGNAGVTAVETAKVIGAGALGAVAASAVGRVPSLVLGVVCISAAFYKDIFPLASAGLGMLIGGTHSSAAATFGEKAKANAQAELDRLTSKVTGSHTPTLSGLGRYKRVSMRSRRGGIGNILIQPETQTQQKTEILMNNQIAPIYPAAERSGEYVRMANGQIAKI